MVIWYCGVLRMQKFHLIGVRWADYLYRDEVSNWHPLFLLWCLWWTDSSLWSSMWCVFGGFLVYRGCLIIRANRRSNRVGARLHLLHVPSWRVAWWVRCLVELGVREIGCFSSGRIPSVNNLFTYWWLPRWSAWFRNQLWTLQGVLLAVAWSAGRVDTWRGDYFRFDLQCVRRVRPSRVLGFHQLAVWENHPCDRR